MTLSEKIVSIALNEVGYTEYPANTNRTKYGKWFGLDGDKWCGIFVSWVYDRAGAPLGNIGFTKGFAGCQTAVAHFKKKNKITDTPIPGDIVFFDWNMDGRYDHTGIYVKDYGTDYIMTVEGNTSLTNQSNGGEVMYRRRLRSQALFVHPTPVISV